MNKRNFLLIFFSLVIVIFLASCKSKNVTVKFDTDGGSSIEEITIKKGQKIDKPTDPIKTDYEFIEWHLDGEPFSFDIAINNSIELQAIWKKLEDVTVDFDSNGGSFIEPITIKEGNSIDKPSDPEKFGYVFDGWFLNDELFDFDSLINNSIILVARWSLSISDDYEEIDLILAEGMKHHVELEFDDEVIIGNKYMVNIDNDGFIEAISKGKTEINIYNKGYLSKTYYVIVIDKVREVELIGPEEFYIEEEVKLSTKIKPLNGFDKFYFEVENPQILSVDAEGNIIPLSVGETTIKVISLQDENIFDEINVVIKKTVLLTNDNTPIKIGNWEFKPGVDLFDNINAALEVSNDETKIILHNMDINNEIVINKNIVFIGVDSTILNELVIDTENIVIEGFEFKDNSKLSSTNKTNKIVFNNNIINNINGDFIDIDNYVDLVISNNQFINISGVAINLTNVLNNSKTLIEKNAFDDNDIAISIEAKSRMKINTFIKIYRNVINDVNKGLSVNMGNENLITNSLIYARFNEFSNYKIAIENIDDNKFEYTFNFFDMQDLDLTKFINVDEKNLKGYYSDKEDILSEEKYNPEAPIIVVVDDMIDELELGETFKINPVVLPYTSSLSYVIINIDNVQSVSLTSNWTLVPLKTGNFKLNIYAMGLKEFEMIYDIEITTEPGIHFEIDNPTYNLKVGDVVNITANPYPYKIKDEKVNFASSDENVALVDQNGKVTVIGEGRFEIVATIEEHFVEEVLTFESKDEFDDEDIMDFITRNQLMYNLLHDISLYGNTVEKSYIYEGVSRIVLHDINRFEKIIPITPDLAFRKGYNFSSDIPSEYKFNPYNVVWIVVHDTGNNNAGAGAELHANYLWNQATGNGREASWHFTVDAKEIWQHMPETEWAYHAGDGSAKPKIGNTSPALGGGNSNGIGIEMSVQSDGHVFKTWQNTARLVAELLIKYNLPLSHQTFHNDFSGKECPQTLRRNGFVDYFHDLVETEYNFLTKFGSKIKSIEIISHNEEYLNNEGRIIKKPNRTITVSYTVRVTTIDDKILEKDFQTRIEGEWR